MKKLMLFSMLSFACFSVAFGQTDTIKAGWGNLDFAVPESPAFQILGVSPDNILKPASVKAIALSLGNYFVTNGPIIPKSLSVEISPLLINGKATLRQYNNNKFFYRMRLSVATVTQQNGGYGVSEGLRFSIIDETDLRTNKEFMSELMRIVTMTADARGKAIASYAKIHPEDPTFLTRLDTDTVLQKEINILALQFYSSDQLDETAISRSRTKIKNQLWNKTIWDAGVAILQTSTDSLISNLKFSQAGAWTSVGLPGWGHASFSQNAQFLLGANISVKDSVKWQTNASFGVRFYYGSNNVKGYLQGQYSYQNSLSSYTASMGCQFNITNGLWGMFTINLIVNNKGKVSYQPGINFGFGTPEKKQ
jgi:hypothetical protein